MLFRSIAVWFIAPGAVNQTAIVNQDGPNSSEVTQTFVLDNSNTFLATINQSDADNESTIDQSDLGPLFVPLADAILTASVTQSGDRNSLQLDQLNREQVATIVQSGNDNTSIASQTFSTNLLTVTQSGNANSSDIATVTQGSCSSFAGRAVARPDRHCMVARDLKFRRNTS